MNRKFQFLPQLGLAVCIGVIACLSLFAQQHSPGAVSAAQNAPIANDTPTVTPAVGIFLPLVANKSVKNPTPTATLTPTCPSSDMVPIPAGPFQMGCDPENDGGLGCPPDESLHTVILDAYCIDRTEVMNRRYRNCVQDGGCTAPANSSSFTRPFYYGNSTYDAYPVIWVSWYQAKEFCQWAHKRLPTEAEWEKAARGASDTRPYPWGSEAPDCSRANFWPYPASNCVGDTSPVGAYSAGASPYGALDMAGNVMEWVNDWFSDTYYSSLSEPVINPQGPATGSWRAVRSGSWWLPASMVRTVSRHAWGPDYWNNVLGFRCARSD